MPDNAEGDKSEEPEISRRARLKKDGIENPEMPECDAPYLVNYLFEVGPTQPAGMGDAPISHAELSAWMQNTGIELSSWEARTLKRLSMEYLSESHAAKEIDCPAPWAEAPYLVAQPDRKAESLRNSLRELAQL